MSHPFGTVLPDDSPVRKCRRCGCTDDHACVDPDGEPCFWVEPDLCSECALCDTGRGVSNVVIYFPPSDPLHATILSLALLAGTFAVLTFVIEFGGRL